jgi:hypothetical protein
MQMSATKLAEQTSSMTRREDLAAVASVYYLTAWRHVVRDLERGRARWSLEEADAIGWIEEV